MTCTQTTHKSSIEINPISLPALWTRTYIKAIKRFHKHFNEGYTHSFCKTTWQASDSTKRITKLQSCCGSLLSLLVIICCVYLSLYCIHQYSPLQTNISEDSGRFSDRPLHTFSAVKHLWTCFLHVFDCMRMRNKLDLRTMAESVKGKKGEQMSQEKIISTFQRLRAEQRAIASKMSELDGEKNEHRSDSK